MHDSIEVMIIRLPVEIISRKINDKDKEILNDKNSKVDKDKTR